MKTLDPLIKIKIIEEELDNIDLNLGLEPDEELEEMYRREREFLESWRSDLMGDKGERPDREELDLKKDLIERWTDGLRQILEFDHELNKKERDELRQDIADLKLWRSEIRTLLKKS